MAFEQLGPTFVKLGQLLSTRPDLIPRDVAEEFKKLHDQVAVIPFKEIEAVLKDHFKDEVFESVDPVPIGAASMAQVYQATLKGGEPVVIKVLRPGIIDTIQQDIEVLYTLARLLTRYIPESHIYDPVGLIDEFSRLIELETNFLVEANNMHKFKMNFAHIPQIKIPNVYTEYSGQKVLVMERLKGIPLKSEGLKDIEREKLLQIVLHAYVQMVFKDGLYHGDLHRGNLLILPDNQLGLIDFGVVGRLNRRTQISIINMFFALSDEDYEWLASEYIDLAPYTDQVDVDQLARSLRDVMAPYYAGNMDVGKILINSTTLASKYQLMLPSELVLFFRSIMAIESLGRLLCKDFDLVDSSLEFIPEVVGAKYAPKKMAQRIGAIFHDSSGLMLALPRQIKQFFRRINSSKFLFEVEINGLREIKRAIEVSSNILFLGLIIGSLILSASLIIVFEKEPFLLDIIPLWSAIGYSFAGVLGMVAFVNYIRK